jgi:IS30 family transposase
MRAVTVSRVKPQAAAPKRSIDLYTTEAKERQTTGHFEIDAMHGKQGGRVVQNKIDRKSRKMFLDFAPALEAKPYADLCLERFKRDIPPGVIQTALEGQRTRALRPCPFRARPGGFSLLLPSVLRIRTGHC